jgi:NAD(P)-dependent dehydrogenase (short-subunit alcohol dehydrogenase family)
MNVEGTVVVVTGGANGIGRALVLRFHSERARAVVVVDRDADGATELAKRVGGLAITCDVASGSQVSSMVGRVEKEVGAIDLYCSNAGVLEPDPDFENAASASDASWARSWGVNVMAHVYAARAVLPSMIARREGYILNTVSAAGLLSQIGSAIYSTTKHAALGFTESLAITHKDHGIRVSALCPQGVDTAMLRDASAQHPAARHPAMNDGVLTPEAVADAVLRGLTNEQFMILPHPSVAEYFRRKAENYDRWVGGMAKLRRAQKASEVGK